MNTNRAQLKRIEAATQGIEAVSEVLIHAPSNANYTAMSRIMRDFSVEIRNALAILVAQEDVREATIGAKPIALSDKRLVDLRNDHPYLRDERSSDKAAL